MSIDDITTADQRVAQAYQSLCDARIDEAQAQLEEALAVYPQDSRLHVMSAALAQSVGHPSNAMSHLWDALAAEPGNELASEELKLLTLTRLTDPRSIHKDFSLGSGERQTAEHAQHIRADHRARYAMAARWLRQTMGRDAWRMTGLDLFCGNGYGSHMLAQNAGVRMIGIDGSADAVTMATRAYGSHRVQFAHAIFPFEMTSGLFDFAVSFESIEHVDDSVGLLTQMAKATDGPFILSVPNEPGLPFKHFGRRFEHHVRHFHREEIQSLLSQHGRRRIVAEYGQQVYRTSNHDIVGLLPESEMGLRPFKEDVSQFLVLIAVCD